MRFIDHSQGVPAKPSHWLLRAVLHLFLAWMCLAGPVLIVCTIMFAEGADFWIGLVVAIVLCVLMIPYGILLWVSEAQEHKQTLRLREVGVSASAEVLAISSASYGEETGMALTLRFAGPEVTPFQATYTCADDPLLSVGDRLGALVDPSTNAYAILNRR
ncbi:MAG TPA: hypothetical protein VF471_03625 [Pseudoxanthomonas sp.]